MFDMEFCYKCLYIVSLIPEMHTIYYFPVKERSVLLCTFFILKVLIFKLLHVFLSLTLFYVLVNSFDSYWLTKDMKIIVLEMQRQ